MKTTTALQTAQARFAGSYEMPAFIQEGIRTYAPNIDTQTFNKLVEAPPRPAGTGEYPFVANSLIVADPHKWISRLTKQSVGPEESDRATEALLREYGDPASEQLFVETIEHARQLLDNNIPHDSAEKIAIHYAKQWDAALQLHTTSTAKRQFLSGAIVHFVRNGYESTYNRLPVTPQTLALLQMPLRTDTSLNSTYRRNVAAAHNLIAYLVRYLDNDDSKLWHALLPTLSHPVFGRARVMNPNDAFSLGIQLGNAIADQNNDRPGTQEPRLVAKQALAATMMQIIERPDLIGESLALYDKCDPEMNTIVAKRAIEVTKVFGTELPTVLLFSEDSRSSIAKLVEYGDGCNTSIHYYFDSRKPEKLANYIESLASQAFLPRIDSTLLAEIICAYAPK